MAWLGFAFAVALHVADEATHDFLSENGWLLQLIAIPLAVVVGVVNATMHVVSSFYYHRMMPGVWS